MRMGPLTPMGAARNLAEQVRHFIDAGEADLIDALDDWDEAIKANGDVNRGDAQAAREDNEPSGVYVSDPRPSATSQSRPGVRMRGGCSNFVSFDPRDTMCLRCGGTGRGEKDAIDDRAPACTYCKGTGRE